jgi:hypothetical protein
MPLSYQERGLGRVHIQPPATFFDKKSPSLLKRGVWGEFIYKKSENLF